MKKGAIYELFKAAGGKEATKADVDRIHFELPRIREVGLLVLELDGSPPSAP